MSEAEYFSKYLSLKLISWIFFHRPRREIYKKIATIVNRGCKFESPPMSPSHQNPMKVRELLKSFEKVCDISHVL